jgi:hypothetical protein
VRFALKPASSRAESVQQKTLPDAGRGIREEFLWCLIMLAAQSDSSKSSGIGTFFATRHYLTLSPMDRLTFNLVVITAYATLIGILVWRHRAE